ncbi:hypothetical protein HYV49_05950 [Candidatus Pacearchaeota archaeon]|nr:hypothetical protein [Candidatus Pacearchaeota archaeon]
MSKEVQPGTLEGFCIGHLTKSITDWCPNCEYDDGNNRCPGYTPIKFGVVGVKDINIIKSEVDYQKIAS